MATHIARVIPKEIRDGACEIPPAAWSDLGLALRRDFNAELRVHDHREAGSYHGKPPREPHYYVEIVLPGMLTPEKALPLVQYVGPIIDEIVAKYTNIDVPHAR